MEAARWWQSRGNGSHHQGLCWWEIATHCWSVLLNPWWRGPRGADGWARGVCVMCVVSVMCVVGVMCVMCVRVRLRV